MTELPPTSIMYSVPFGKVCEVGAIVLGCSARVTFLKNSSMAYISKSIEVGDQGLSTVLIAIENK
jgi:hypothetical protein